MIIQFLFILKIRCKMFKLLCWKLNNETIFMKKTGLFLTIAVMQFLTVSLLNAKTIEDSRIKMLNGEYAKILDFNRDGPMIINFWTTW